MTERRPNPAVTNPCESCSGWGGHIVNKGTDREDSQTCLECRGTGRKPVSTIAELEYRLQLAQHARADAERSVRLHTYREEQAQAALTKARIEQGET